MLVLNRTSGRSVWIGRSVTVTMLDKLGSERWTMMVEAPKHFAVTGPCPRIATHIQKQYAAEKHGKDQSLISTMITLGSQESVQIGRGMKITLLSIDRDNARLGIDAPRHLAVSRDDFSRDEHLAFQQERDEAFFQQDGQ